MEANKKHRCFYFRQEESDQTSAVGSVSTPFIGQVQFSVCLHMHIDNNIF
jgi:hypothetical protein